MKKLFLTLILLGLCPSISQGMENFLLDLPRDIQNEIIVHLGDSASNYADKWNTVGALALTCKTYKELVRNYLFSKNTIGSPQATLFELSKKGKMSSLVLNLLIDAGADVNTKDNDGWTSLMRASMNGGHKEIVELLIKNNVDVNAKDNHGQTALMYASRYGYKGIVELLINNKADVNAKDNIYGWTALMHAALYGHKEIVDLLEKAAKSAEKKEVNCNN